MALRPTSFRLPEDLLERLEEAGRATGAPVTTLVATMLDEGLKIRRFPGIVYRDGPAGRRAGLVMGPDIWEIIRDLRHAPGHGMERIENLASEVGIPVERIRLAVDFYAEYPDEIDRFIEADERAIAHVRQVVSRRERLLSS
jgi:hypothetical protein